MSSFSSKYILQFAEIQANENALQAISRPILAAVAAQLNRWQAKMSSGTVMRGRQPAEPVTTMMSFCQATWNS